MEFELDGDGKPCQQQCCSYAYGHTGSTAGKTGVYHGNKGFLLGWIICLDNITLVYNELTSFGICNTMASNCEAASH